MPGPTSLHATIVCLRHGPLDRRFEQAAIGRTDAPLDEGAAEREERVVAAAAAFKPVRVLSSDRRRCAGTAAKIAAAAGATHGARRDLRDRDFGRFEGRNWPDLVAAEPDLATTFLNAFASAAPPEGEALPDVAARV